MCLTCNRATHGTHFVCKTSGTKARGVFTPPLHHFLCHSPAITPPNVEEPNMISHRATSEIANNESLNLRNMRWQTLAILKHQQNTNHESKTECVTNGWTQTDRLQTNREAHTEENTFCVVVCFVLPTCVPTSELTMLLTTYLHQKGWDKFE